MAQRVGPYILSKTLGVGSTGRVKLGTHIDTNHTVAVKIVSKDWLATKASLQKKIEREITLMKLIRHAHVLSLNDVYESNTELFLVLEYVEGGELFDYLVKRGRLPEREALIFFQQIVNGLDFCHQHLICHRDLKPENLLLDSNLNVKIADFGMATLQPEGKYLETSCGSPHYASPEIIKGEKYDGPAADIWSCGVILYALLTGNLPFDDENIRKLLSKVKSGLYFLPNSLSEGSRDLIKRMLVTDPAKRITIQQIKEHPWFNSNSNTNTVKEVLPPVLGRPPKSTDELDMEVVANLKTLGYEDEQELIQNILSQERTMEQIFYLLLLERKKEFFENADSNDDTWDDPQGPRRRSSSLSGGEQGFRRSMSGGTVGRFGDGSAVSSVPTNPSLLHSSTSAGSLEFPPATPTSPISPKTPSTPIEEESESIAKSSSGSLTPESPRRVMVEGTSPSPTSPNRASSMFRGRASSDGMKMRPTAISPKKKINISIDVPPTDASKPIIGTPKFHRRRQSENVEIPGSPSSTPKKSWFSSLFNFKGEIVTIRSSKSVTDTAAALQTAFTALNIKVAPGSVDYKYKCRAEPAGKAIRLRVEICATADFEFDVLFIQERGNTQAFIQLVDEILERTKIEKQGEVASRS